MGKKLRTIYEYFEDYTEEEIDEVIASLSEKDKIILRDRFGDDLKNPVITENYDSHKRGQYYSTLLPKITLLLAKNKIKNLEKKLENERKLTMLEDEVLSLIKKNKNNSQICSELKIDEKTFLKVLLRLKNSGISLIRKYYSDASIKYRHSRTVFDLKSMSINDQEKIIITGPKEIDFKTLLISDLHFGNKYERLDLINRAFNYCKKNDINIILCGGDLIDGNFSGGEQTLPDVSDQIKYFLENYPYDRNILTFSVGGDHDLSALKANAFNLIEICQNYRQDIIIGGYNNVNICIKNDRILLHHSTMRGRIFTPNGPIVLHGHAHKYYTSFKKNVLNVSIPSLSEINQPMPSALELNLRFNKGYIETAIIKHLCFLDKDIILGESKFNLLKDRNAPNGPIKNVELFKKHKN